MIGGSSAAGLFGGFGLFLVGTRWVRAGLAEYADRFADDGSVRTRTPRNAALAGVSLGAPLCGSSELAPAAAHLGRNRGLLSERVTLLSIGASYGPLVAGALALLASLGWTVPAIGVVALLAGAVIPLARHDWERRAEAMAGWGMVIFGIAAMGWSWEELARSMAGQLGAQGPLGVALLVLLGASAAAMLRSPALVTCAALQASACGALHVGSGLAVMAGAVVGSSAGFVSWIRRGSLDERVIAVGHALFSLLWCAFLVGILASLSAVVGYLAEAPGGPGVSLLVLLALGATSASLLTHVLLGPTEHLVRSRLEPSATSTTTLEWHGAPEILGSELSSALGNAAESTRDLARAVLGHMNAGSKSRTRAISDLEETLGAIDRFRVERSAERLPLSVGCALHAARGCAEALRIAAVHLNDHRPTSPIDDRGLDKRLRQSRLATLKLVESGRPEERSFTLEAWSEQVLGVQTGLAEVWSQGAAGAGTGALHPLHLVELKEELETLSAVVREVDRAVWEWSSLVPGLEWGASPEQPDQEPSTPVREPAVTQLY